MTVNVASSLQAVESSGTITGLPALLIILAIVGVIFGVGFAIGRLSKRPKQ